MNKNQYPNEAKNTQKPEEKVFQKKVFGVVLFLGVAAFVIGIWQFYHNLTKPFKIENSVFTQAISTENIYQGEPTSLDYLKTKDTDGDSLTDYDELYTYKTSPYLADSDSDKINDKQEIESGTDPNCPQGKNCGQTSGNTNITQVAGAGQNANASQQLSLNPDDVSVDLLRQTLIQSGAPETTINGMDDATLREMYKEVLTEQGIDVNANLTVDVGGLNVNTAQLNTDQINYSNITLDEMQNLKAAEIRDLLKNSGIGEDVLNQIDDKTLESIYQQSLAGQIEELQSNTNAAE